jgi:hypothetical protein
MDETISGQPSADLPLEASSPVLPSPATNNLWAICCSGGGMRAAGYCLGGLQRLDELGLLGAAKWIIGVSGGSYIAASRALVAHDLPPGTVPHAYAPGTPEEQNLLGNAGRVAAAASPGLVGGLSLLGALVMVTVVLAPLYAFSHVWGWLLNWQGVLVRTGPDLKMSADVSAPSWWVVPVVAGTIAVLLFVNLWRTFRSSPPLTMSNRGERTIGVVAVATGLAMAMLAVPVLISWLSGSTGAVGSVVHFFALIKSQYLSRAALPGLIAVAVAVARTIKRELDQANDPADVNTTGAAADRSAGSKVASWALNRLLPWLASALLITMGAVAALLWTASAAATGFTLSQLWPVTVALAIMLLSRVAMDVNNSSLQNLYRWRIAATYAVTRRAALARDPRVREPLFAKAAVTRLSELRGDIGAGQPGLVIGTTANVGANRLVAPGRGGYSLAFDPDKVSLRSAPTAGEPGVQARTSDYEALLGHTRLTLFDLVTISGAPLSPRIRAMAQRRAYRFLLILTNMRLGAWMPHPALVRQARNQLNRHAAGESGLPDRWWARRPLLLLLWYFSPHPLWDRNANLNANREARLWAHVLDLRLSDKRTSGLWYGLMQPTVGLLWAEAAGHTSYRATWIKVSDGDHHDNLGLVEALHRGAGNILALDASGDPTGTWQTVGRAISLATSEAEVEINLDPPATPSDGGVTVSDGEVTRPWTHGTFTRPWLQEGRGLARHGHIWVGRLDWKEGAPWHLRPNLADSPDHPHETTPSWLYDSSNAELYRRLGASVVEGVERDRNSLLVPDPRTR